VAETSPETPLKKTPLNAIERELGGKMVDFGGWDLPVQFSGILDEHKAVRERAGLFDVSHMGEIAVHGPDALAFLQKVTSNDVAKLEDGRIHYSGLLYPTAGFVDDILVYRNAEDDYLVVVNASNTDKDYEWMRDAVGDHDVVVENRSSQFAQLALQGPLAEAILQPLTETDLRSIKYYHFTRGKVDGVDAIISRTGYTGEDGFELYVAPDKAEALFRRLLEAGGPRGLLPCGLGARA
jgi:aminomethyltransferase